MLVNTTSLLKIVKAPPKVDEQLETDMLFPLKLTNLRYIAPPASPVDLSLMNLVFLMVKLVLFS